MRCIWPASTRSITNPFRVNLTRYTRSAHNAAAAAIEQAHSPPHYELTDAQTSRAASAVVRHFCSTGELRNAYFIINSLRSTSPLPTSFSRSIPSDPLHNVLNDRDTLDFGGKNISPRLACHSLLHGLVRVGCTKKAGRLVQMMMEDGIPIRSRTLQTVIQSLAHTPEPSALLQIKAHFNTSKPSNSLQLNPSCVGNTYLKFATHLLLDARKYRQRRTTDMFSALIRACILQGEIIVGSLLLVLAVKDWQLRASRKDTVNTTDAIQDEHSDAPYPPQASMKHLLTSIEKGIQRGDEATQQACMQGLANIASLLEEQRLPFSQVGPLIRVLMRYPRSTYDVWIHSPSPDSDPPLPTQTKASGYFDRVLFHTATHLPTARSKKKKKRCKKEEKVERILPPLDLHSYNAILQYVLHHRKDVPLARGIVRQMKFEDRFEPDAATQNILMKAEATHQRPLHLTATETHDLQSQGTNSHALPSRVTYLTAMGQPEATVALLFRLIPELGIISHHSTSFTTRKLSREAALKQAVAYGPYFFSTVLNALCKAGRTGLAEMVWFLAKEAERASWCEEGGKGWCLPVHAYTSMIQCYASEARRPRSLDLNWNESVPSEVRNKRFVKGWARYLIVRKKILGKRINKREASQLVAAELNKSMKAGAMHVFYSMMHMHHPSSSIQVPSPDARFFNALLSLFTKPTRSCRRRTPSHYRRHLRTAETYYTRFWITSAYWHPFLKELADAMHGTGYDVPIGFGYLFVGRHAPATKGDEGRSKGKFRPFRLKDDGGLKVGSRRQRRRRGGRKILLRQSF